jgi:cobalamin synthase
MHIYIHTYTYIYKYECIYIPYQRSGSNIASEVVHSLRYSWHIIHIYVYIYIFIYAYIHTYIHIYICMMHIYTLSEMRFRHSFGGSSFTTIFMAYNSSIYIYIYIYIYICIYTYIPYQRWGSNIALEVVHWLWYSWRSVDAL